MLLALLLHVGEGLCELVGVGVRDGVREREGLRVDVAVTVGVLLGDGVLVEGGDGVVVEVKPQCSGMKHFLNIAQTIGTSMWPQECQLVTYEQVHMNSNTALEMPM